MQKAEFLWKCFFLKLHLTKSIFYGIIVVNYGEKISKNERDGESGMDECGSRTGADPLPVSKSSAV